MYGPAVCCALIYIMYSVTGCITVMNLGSNANKAVRLRVTRYSSIQCLKPKPEVHHQVITHQIPDRNIRSNRRFYRLLHTALCHPDK